MNTSCERTGSALRAWLMALACAAGAVAQAATPLALPSIGDFGKPEHHPGKIIWADLITPNLAGAESFYGALFGWTFQSVHVGEADYALAMLGGRPVGGLLQRAIPEGEHRQSAWLTFISVRDVDAAQRIALSHGAKSLSEPRSYPGRGRQAVFTDPDGAVFAVLASKTGDPPDFLAAPGEWIWSSLLTRDPSQSVAFYQTLFGYEVFDLPSDDGLDHMILSSEDYARASANVLPDNTEHRHPHWLNFVRVTDAVAATAKVVALGGRVIVEPHPDRQGGMLAVIADPAGAPLGLMEWSDADMKPEPK